MGPPGTSGPWGPFSAALSRQLAGLENALHASDIWGVTQILALHLLVRTVVYKWRLNKNESWSFIWASITWAPSDPSCSLSWILGPTLGLCFYSSVCPSSEEFAFLLRCTAQLGPVHPSFPVSTSDLLVPFLVPQGILVLCPAWTCLSRLLHSSRSFLSSSLRSF